MDRRVWPALMASLVSALIAVDDGAGQVAESGSGSPVSGATGEASGKSDQDSGPIAGDVGPGAIPTGHVTELTRSPAACVWRNQVMVPAKVVFGFLGARVHYNALDSAIEVWIDDANGCEIGVGAPMAAVTTKGRREQRQLDAAAFIEKGVMYVPLQLVALVAGASTVYDAANRRVYVNHRGKAGSISVSRRVPDPDPKELECTPPACLLRGHLMAPARCVAQWLGMSVEYDPFYRTVRTGDLATLHVGSTKAIAAKDGQLTDVDLECVPFMMRGALYVPVRFLCELSGAPVTYDPVRWRACIGTGDEAGAFTVSQRSPSPEPEPIYRGAVAYLQKLIVLREGNGIQIYFTMCDRHGAQTKADGRAQLSIYRDARVVWKHCFEVRRKDFVRTTIGLGAFAHKETILPYGRIPYSAFGGAASDFETGRAVLEWIGKTHPEPLEETFVF